MQTLVTGATGFVGAKLVGALQRAGHDVRAFARDPARVEADVPVVKGDAVTGAGFAEAMDGVDCAYFLIHSMEASAGDGFSELERRSVEHFVEAARAAGVPRAVYLGGPVPEGARASHHLSSRLVVEEALMAGFDEAVALRASIIIGARSRSFRFLVRLVERLPALPLPPWREFRTAPIDERDVIAMLVAAASTEHARGGLSLDIAGPDVLSYGEIIETIADLMLVGRVPIRLGFSASAVASRVAAAIAGEDHALIGPLMEGLTSDLLPRDARAAELLGVRLHRFERAVEHALAEWERSEPLAAR
ncbi:MAG: NAD(P)H-binding protein [Solirubrobacteraceae bacterium]